MRDLQEAASLTYENRLNVPSTDSRCKLVDKSTEAQFKSDCNDT